MRACAAQGRSPSPPTKCSGSSGSSKQRRRWLVDWTPEAHEQLAALPHEVQRHARITVRTRLAVNPRDPRWALALRDERAGFWRAYAGDLHRLVYEIHHPGRVLIARIGPRKTVYRCD